MGRGDLRWQGFKVNCGSNVTVNTALRILQAEIDIRCRALTAQHPDWPCRRGCDDCCRRLAALPSLSQPEWELLRQGVSALPETAQGEIRQRLASLPGGPPFVCPFLDDVSGACLVYEHRPLACRMYGFYAERDHGLYCGLILEREQRGDFAGAMWGNACAMDARAGDLGPRLDLCEAIAAGYLAAG